MPIVGFIHRLPILHLPKTIINIYTKGKTINQFAIGYMINPPLKFNSASSTQVEKRLGYYYSIGTMKNIRNFLMKNNTSVMTLMMIYEIMEKYQIFL